jgi:hypothetical protein
LQKEKSKRSKKDRKKRKKRNDGSDAAAVESVLNSINHEEGDELISTFISDYAEHINEQAESMPENESWFSTTPPSVSLDVALD